MEIAYSINKVPIRLTEERWKHISLGHPEMASFFDEIMETVEEPEAVYQGKSNENIAVKKSTDATDKYVVVIYKEIDKFDGFVITSFVTNKKVYFERKTLIWKP